MKSDSRYTVFVWTVVTRVYIGKNLLVITVDFQHCRLMSLFYLRNCSLLFSYNLMHNYKVWLPVCEKLLKIVTVTGLCSSV